MLALKDTSQNQWQDGVQNAEERQQNVHLGVNRAVHHLKLDQQRIEQPERRQGQQPDQGAIPWNMGVDAAREPNGDAQQQEPHRDDQVRAGQREADQTGPGLRVSRLHLKPCIETTIRPGGDQDR